MKLPKLQSITTCCFKLICSDTSHLEIMIGTVVFHAWFGVIKQTKQNKKPKGYGINCYCRKSCIIKPVTATMGQQKIYVQALYCHVRTSQMSTLNIRLHSFLLALRHFIKETE